MKKTAKIISLLLAFVMLVGMIPSFAARAEDFTFTVTASGAASGNISDYQTLRIMSGQKITFTFKSDTPYQFYAGVYGVVGPLSSSTVEISDYEKRVTVTANEISEYQGNNALHIYFYDIDADLEGPDYVPELARMTIYIEVRPFKITSIDIDRESITIPVGTQVKLEAVCLPEYRPGYASWESYDESIAEVSDDGTVTAVTPGSTRVALWSVYDLFVNDECTVTVVETLPVESVSISLREGSGDIGSDDAITLVEGDTAQLDAAVTPEFTTDDTVTWSIAPAGVATVDQTGKVTAVSAGSAIVTAAAGNKTDTCTVRVLRHVAAKDETCTADGNIEYWEDGEGNKFSDAAGTQAISDSAVIVPKHEHPWDDGVVTKEPTRTEPGTLLFTCGECGEERETEIPKITGTNGYSFKTKGHEYILGSGKIPEMIVERNVNDEETITRFEGLLIGGKEVDAKNYDAKPGSVKLILKKDYLEKLRPGTYKVTFLFNNGYAESALTVKSSSGDSGTGDSLSAAAIIASAMLLLASAAYLAYRLFTKKAKAE